ncbi:MAG: hypothetical protein H0U71_07295 [Gammaproteobacteria bacterium]|nr:hypothetical protein [Gammaproteobacteria bacterium]
MVWNLTKRTFEIQKKQDGALKKKRLIFVKIFMTIYGICFIFGGLRHWLDIMHAGILPYTGIPPFFNFYLTSLAILDFMVVIMLLLRPIHGLIFAVIIMASDLLIDFHLSKTYWHTSLFENIGLQLLAMFGIFLFFTAPFIIKCIIREQQQNQ